MKYLFFDIECGKCEKGGKGYICEFGYTITDENFKCIESDNYMMNPDHEFDSHVLQHILHHTEEEYLCCPKFPAFYEKIAALLNDKMYIIIGHSTKTDLGYLAFECIRYKLPQIKCKIYDIRDSFKVVRQDNNYTGLDKMFEKLGLAKPDNLHGAQADADATMVILKKLCAMYRKTPISILQVASHSVKVNNSNTNKSKKENCKQ